MSVYNVPSSGWKEIMVKVMIADKFGYNIAEGSNILTYSEYISMTGYLGDAGYRRSIQFLYNDAENIIGNSLLRGQLCNVNILWNIQQPGTTSASLTLAVTDGGYKTFTQTSGIYLLSNPQKIISIGTAQIPNLVYQIWMR
jgi:hypothetical protein